MLTAGPTRTTIANGVKVAVRRDTRALGAGAPDTYDIYSARFGFGEWRPVRPLLRSTSVKQSVKDAVVDLCQEIYESL